MAYSKQQAHEYYVNYRKKGLLKGRSKGKSKANFSSKNKKTVTKDTNNTRSNVSDMLGDNKVPSSIKKKWEKANRDKANAECKEARARIAAEKKEFMAQYREQVKAAVDSLRQEMRARLKGMKKGPEKDALKKEYEERIKQMQELKKQQTEEFNNYFEQYKNQTVNDIRAKYGLDPLKPNRTVKLDVQLSSEQNDKLSSALEAVRSK